MSRLTIAEKIVLHMSRYELMSEDGFNMTWDLTQDGMAASLRISRAHSSIELKKLRESGKVVERQSHVRGCKAKRKSYCLTPKGMDDAKRLREFAEKEGIDIMPMLDMRRCEPEALWDSIDETDRDAFGLACVLRCPVPRDDIPETTGTVMPVDVNGMVMLNETVKENFLSVTDEEKARGWHSTAADYWLDRGDVQERLYHLISAGRVRDACMLIVHEKETLLYNINDDLSNILSDLSQIPGKYVNDVVPVMISVALESDDIDSARQMISLLNEKDEELALLYSAELEIMSGNHGRAEEIVNSSGGTARFEVNLLKAKALRQLDRTEEAVRILASMKDILIKSGTVEGLDRIYIQMADIAVRSNDGDSSINYLTKALAVADDSGKKRIYGLLASSYGAVGMHGKSTECLSRSR